MPIVRSSGPASTRAARWASEAQAPVKVGVDDFDFHAKLRPDLIEHL